MLDLSLGDPRGAHLFFLFMLFLGATLGGVVFGVVAFPWARRPRYRNFNAMPRTGALCGAGIALFIAYIAWSTAFGEFYRIEIREGVAHLHYHMPRRTPALPMEKIQGMRQSMTLDKLNPWRIQLETAEGVYFSTNMNRAQMEKVWRSLTDFVRPLA
jgi:hypothetical protein